MTKNKLAAIESLKAAIALLEDDEPAVVNTIKAPDIIRNPPPIAITPALPVGFPAVKLDMSDHEPGKRLAPIKEGGEHSNEIAPPGYVLCAVNSKAPPDSQFAGLVFTEHGGATLIRGVRGGARYVLGCGHVPCTPHPKTGELQANGFEHTFSIRPSCRADQPLRFSSTEVYVHPYYEANASTYRFDLSLTVLPEAVDDSHAISRHDMRLHAVDPGEELMYCGMGAQEEGGDIHQALHIGKMRATNKALGHITELEPIDDEFEQGFSGGPFYSLRDDMAWSGVVSHYLKGDGGRAHYLIPASVALPWADRLITLIEEAEFA